MKYLLNKYKERNTLKVVLIVTTIAYVISLALVSFNYEKRIDMLLEGMYAIDKDNGVVVKLEKSDYTNDDRISEYKSHMRLWFKSFYQFDQHTFLDNMEDAKNYMSSENYEIEIDKYRKDKILERISEDDLILTVNITALNVIISERVPVGNFSLVQSYRKGDMIKERVFEGEFKLMDTEGRTDENSHAVSIYDYVITRKEKLN